MMLKRSLVIAALISLSIGLSNVSAQAGGSCPERVDMALASASFVVETHILQELKSYPADPSAAYRVAALNLPTTDGSALNLLLMGQSTLETNASPTTVTETVSSVEATAASNANLRSSPSTNGALAGSVQSGQALQLVGKNAAGDWYQVLRQSQQTAWIFGQLVTVDAAAAADLPVSESDDSAPNTSLPALSLTFRAAADEAACADAAAGLTVQTAADTGATFSLNGAAIDLWGTAIIQMQPIEIAGDSDNDTVTIATLVNGQMTINLDSRPIALTQPGDTLGITSANTVHSANDVLVERLRAAFGELCENTVKTGLLDIQADHCNTLVLRDLSASLPQFADAVKDVLVCGTGQSASAADSVGADILGANIRRAEATSPIPDGFLIDVFMDVPPANTLDTAYSFAIVVWEHDANGSRSKGKLYQIHQGVPTMGQINTNFAAVSGTESHVSAGANSATFNVGAETKQIDIESFLMLTPNAKRVCDTFHSDIDEAFLTG